MPCRRAAALAVALGLALAPWAVRAGEAPPGILYALGTKFDKSFNESAWRGVERFRRKTGVAPREIEITNADQRVQALSALMRGGAPIVVAVGFDQRDAVARVADRYPKARFVIIDTVLDKPNVESVVFRDGEGAFLVGVLGAMASKSGTIGYVGGMDMPIIRRIERGYRAGARWAVPGVKVLSNFAGTTEAAFTDPARGAELAKSQFDRGADVVFAAAGITGYGALQAAKDRGRLAIGMDSNQDGFFPGNVLTSLLKRVDRAVYDAFMATRRGNWRPGVKSLGLAEGGVDYSVDEYNKALLTPAMREKAEEARRLIVTGKLVLRDAP